MPYAEEIKIRLIQWLRAGNMKFDVNKHIIANEVQFGPLMRRADLLLIMDGLHAIEIKSENDTIRRLQGQCEDYKKTFDCTSIAVTPKHIDTVLKIVPASFGIILLDENKIIEYRKAKTLKRLSKLFLSSFLSKNVLLKKLGSYYRHLDTFTLRKILIEKNSIPEIRDITIQVLTNRYQRLFHNFLFDTQNDCTEDDLLLLNRKIPTGFNFLTSSNVDSFVL